MNSFWCNFPVLKNYKGNFKSFLTETILGTYIDHFEFTASRRVIWLFLIKHKRYVSSVCTESYLGSFLKRRKNVLKISLKIKSSEHIHTSDHLDIYCISRDYLSFLKNCKRYFSSVCTKIFLGSYSKSQKCSGKCF